MVRDIFVFFYASQVLLIIDLFQFVAFLIIIAFYFYIFINIFIEFFLSHLVCCLLSIWS